MIPIGTKVITKDDRGYWEKGEVGIIVGSDGDESYKRYKIFFEGRNKTLSAVEQWIEVIAEPEPQIIITLTDSERSWF